MVELHYGNNQIRDRSQFGIYYGNQPIEKIYHGSQKVYQFQPYEPDEILTYASPDSYTINLPKGVYQIALGGAKGTNTSWAYGGYAWGASGGGGAFVEVTFYNPQTQVLEIVAGSSGNAYMNLGGLRMLTATAGTNASTDNAGKGGTVTINSALDITSVINNISGKNGGKAAGSTPSVATVSTYGNWGSTANPNGGARLQYLRVER